jgi:hypothetical protein
MADFWCLSQGKAIGAFDKENEAVEKIEMKPCLPLSGTCGVDAHVIGTKIISRSLKEAGFNVVAWAPRLRRRSLSRPLRRPTPTLCSLPLSTAWPKWICRASR